MSKPNIFNDAIAEAKVIRETAFSNAKLAMAESFAPQIKNMLSSQLNELEEEDSEMSLDELLNELEGQEGQISEESTEETEVEFEAPEGEIEGEEEINGEVEGDDVVGEITVDELKDIIRQVQQELNGEESEEEFETEEGEIDFQLEPDGEEELDMVAEEFDPNLDEYMQEPSDAAAAGLDNLISMIKKAYAKTPEIINRIKKELEDAGRAAGSAMRSEATELQEAKKVILEQSKLLKEMNLLNSKLLYVNKIFKAKNLSESQKVKVVNALDRGKDVKETKNIFLTLKESLITTPTVKMNENRGAASRSAGVAPKALNEQVSTQESDFVLRMQQLAGIIK